MWVTHYWILHNLYSCTISCNVFKYIHLMLHVFLVARFRLVLMWQFINKCGLHDSSITNGSKMLSTILEIGTSLQILLEHKLLARRGKCVQSQSLRGTFPGTHHFLTNQHWFIMLPNWQLMNFCQILGWQLLMTQNNNSYLNHHINYAHKNFLL